MAVKAARAAVLLALSLCLGSCGVLQFIFGSLFPSTVTLLQARADLSAQIGKQGYSYNLRVVESGTYGYVVLDANVGSPAPVYIMDLNLNLKKTLTGLTDVGVMVDGFTGDIVIGNQVLNPSDLTLVSTLATATVGYQGQEGADGFFFAAGGWNVGNLYISTGSSALSFSNFSAAWATTTASPGPALSAVQNNLMLSGVFDDGNPADNIILAVTLSNSAAIPTTYFLSMPRSDFNATTPAGAGILDISLHRDGLLTNSVGYANGKLLAWDTASQSYVAMDPATLATTASFYAPADKSNMGRLRFAYRAGGGSFYTFDQSTGVVTRYSAWW
jgi:hypothetical protein